ncbi:MAG: hypothetical protein IJ179_08115 [Oscillospiraceae bacterium]|nr:hypothetical protein [Oscillospiraceae bacterium]
MIKKTGFFFLMILTFALLLSACGASGAQDTAAAETAAPAADVAPDADAVTAQPETDAQQDAAAAGTEPAGAALGFTERGDSISGEYTDGSGNRYTYSYSLPLVSGDTDYAAAVNKELDEVYETYIAPELQHMDAGNSIITTCASWRSAEYKGVTSLLVYLHNDWDESAYRVYHFTADGEQVTNPALLDTLGLSGEAFTAAASERLSDRIGYDPANYKSDEIRAAMEECLEKTLAPENCNAEMPIYVTSSGIVCFVGRVYTPAGAGYYDRLFVLSSEDGSADEELAELQAMLAA